MNDRALITSVTENGKTRVMADNSTIGWVTEWYDHPAVNVTGTKKFQAKPIGGAPSRDDCESYASAVAYIRGYLGI